MARYIAKQRSPIRSWEWNEYWRDEADATQSLVREVFEPEPIDTGLLDKDVHEIVRVMDQIGFIRS